MKLKRIFAYLIDLFIISFLAAFIYSMVPVFADNNEEYEKTVNEYYDLLVNDTSGSADISEEDLINLTYNMQILTKPLLFIRAGLLILYFGVIAYIAKGQTLGKKLLKLQVVSNDGGNLNPGLFILRSIIVTNFIPEIIGLITLIVCSKNTWFEINNVLTNISYLIYFLLLGFMIFRDDERGLHDLIAKTKVISTKK